MTTEIVIARYNENLDWIKLLPNDIKITIYNKGKNDIEYPFIPLKNIGRESHTYLYHIIMNYNNLADTTIFCQGGSIFHSPDFIKLIENRSEFQPLQPLSAFYWPEGESPNYFSNPPLPILEKTKNLWIKEKYKVHVEYMNNDFVTIYPYFYHENYFIKMIDNIKKYYNIENVLEFNIERLRLKNVDTKKLFPICYAGLFAVTRNVIQENSIDFYNNIMSILIYDTWILDNGKKLDNGLFLEKLWLLIFNYKKNNKHYIDLNVCDFDIYDKNLVVKNNSIHFKYFVIYCQIYIELKFNNLEENVCIFISKYNTYILYKKTKIYKNNIRTSELQNILKDMNLITVLIHFRNNIISIFVNEQFILSFNLKNILKEFNENKIISAKIFEVTDNNKIIDLFV
jgi:hypothetical protein